MRNEVLGWHADRAVSVVDAGGLRHVGVEWQVDRVELTADGRFVAAWGDQGRRLRVWRTLELAPVLDLVGAERRHSLTGGIALVGDHGYAFTAARDGTMSITELDHGTRRGWLSTTGLAWFHVDRVFGLTPDWLAVRGHRDGEPYDTVVAVESRRALDDDQALQTALTGPPRIRDWGYQLGIGPLGHEEVAIIRDAEWEPDDQPDDPAEAFRGIVVHDLRDGSVTERIPYLGTLSAGVTIGGDGQRIAISQHGQIELVARATGEVQRRAAIALDPHRLAVAEVDGDHIAISEL